MTQAPLILYAENTPNPNAMMFVANRQLLPDETVLEFENAANAGPSPLAQALFKFPFVSGVFISRNVVTITKNDGSDWNALVLELREFLKEFITDGGLVYNGDPVSNTTKGTDGENESSEGSAGHAEPKNETEQKIIDILEEYVRPAVESDGGAISFRTLTADGVVVVALRGACSGCPSSTITLKAGIEALMKRMIPEVSEVRAEAG